MRRTQRVVIPSLESLQTRQPIHSIRNLKDSIPLPTRSPANATSGEWGVAFGSSDEEDAFADSQAAVLDGSYRREKSNYSEDPYLRKKTQTTSGLYSQDPYALYHEGEEDEEDADRYHNAAESMGLGTANKSKKRYVGKWV